jgi:hypothetical protein
MRVALPVATVAVAAAIGILAALAGVQAFVGLAGAGLIYATSRGAWPGAATAVLGGITLLNVSPGFTIEKFAYLVLVFANVTFAGARIAARAKRVQEVGAIPLILATSGLAAVVAISLVVALSDSISVQLWALDIAVYGLLVAAPIIGVDLGLNARARSISFALIAIGCVTAVSYSIYRLQLRGFTHFDIGRFLLATQFLPAAAFCVCLAYAFAGRRSYVMAFLAASIVACILLSGTRITLLFIVPFVVTFILASRKRRPRLSSIAFGAAGVAAVVAVLLTNSVVAQYVAVDALLARLGSVLPLLSSLDVTRDPSLYGRYLLTYYQTNTWLQHPWFGIGPGALYSSGTATVRAEDSPVAILARFGLLGTAIVILFFAAIAFAKLRTRAHWIPRTALLSFLSLIVASSVVSSPLNDTGVALGLIPLIALCVSWREESDLAVDQPVQPRRPARAPLDGVAGSRNA